MPNDSKKSAILSSVITGKISSFIGYFLVAFFGLGFLVTMSSSDMAPELKTTGYIICPLFIFLGFLSTQVGSNLKKMVGRFRCYVALLSSGVTSLQQIADSTCNSRDFVIKDMDRMIKLGCFTGISLDIIEGKVLCFQGEAPNLCSSPRLEPPGCSVHCPGCGAVNSVTPGVAKRCDYCGTFLKN